MLIRTFPPHRRSNQKGVVLLVTLIMLVAMTLAAIALMRSVDTANVVAGNLAFQQSAYHAADTGTEQAIAYLYTIPNVKCNGTGVGIACATGYKSFHEPALEPPTAGATWDSFWQAISSNAGTVDVTGLPTGYEGSFVIESMCANPEQQDCTIVNTTIATTTPQGQNMGSQQRAFNNATNTTNVHYYRITTRVVGPRNSSAYIQALIAL